MIKKYLIKIFVIFTFLTINVNGEIVNKISIDGNKRISYETILVLGQISKGKDLNDSDLNEIIKNLFETNFFEDIDLVFKNGELNIKLIENPIIENIEISGVKNKTFIKNIKDSKISVEDYVKSADNDLTVKSFVRVSLV